MEFRRSGQLDRRRRVLMDEIASPPSDSEKDAKPSTSSAKGPLRAYPPAALEEGQPRLADLIPHRPFALAMLALVGLTLIAGIETVYIHLYGAHFAGALQALDLTQRGNVAGWFASLVLAGGAAAALLVYSIRVHRVDDYRGRYRVWLWTAAALAWASFDAATGVHHSVNYGLAVISGVELNGLGSVLWLGLYGLAFGTLGVRLACEMWPSLEAFGGLAIAAMLYLLCGLCDVGVLVTESPIVNTVAATTLALLAHGTVTYSIVIYARHVHLDAQGRLLVDAKPAKKKPRSRAKLSVVSADEADEKPRKKATPKPATNESDKEQAPPSGNTIGAAISAATASKPVVAKPTLAATDDDEDDDSDLYDADGNKLSKSERRRLKKLARREQQQQQQRRAA